MTPEQIEQWAREAECDIVGSVYLFNARQLTRFAELVAQAERERRPKLMPGHLIEAHMAVIGGNKDHMVGTSNWAYSMLRELGKLVDCNSKQGGEVG